MALNPAAFGLTAAALLIVLLAPAQARAEGDPERGRKLAYTCHGCHGIENYKNAYPNYSVPKLGGQHAAYLIAALDEYDAKARWHPTMRGLAATLTGQDKADIAAFFEGAEAVGSSGKIVGTPPDAAQTCVACHGQDGVGITPEYPTIAGQHADYMEHALESYRSGARKNEVMAQQVAQLTPEQVREISEFFARQEPALKTVPIREKLTASK